MPLIATGVGVALLGGLLVLPAFGKDIFATTKEPQKKVRSFRSGKWAHAGVLDGLGVLRDSELKRPLL